MKRKHILLLIVFIFSCLHLSAQVASSFLDINKIKALIYADGTMFWETSSEKSSFEVPQGSGKHTIFSAQLNIGGIDEGSNLYTAGQTYRKAGSDFWVGPLKTDGTASNPADWNRMWKLNKSTIENHKLNYNKPGYVVPNELLEWPGNGQAGYDEIQAPFVDFDGDKKYEPADGDYPFVPGDQVIYFIINDNYQTHTQFPGGRPFKIEVHGMLYGYTNSGDEVLDHTIFINYRIINRSRISYTGVFAGIWSDLDIGYSNDDYCATDPARNMIYAYNADTYDDVVAGANGYGLYPPAQGIVFLGKPLAKSLYFTDKGIAGKNDDPVKAIEIYRYLSGLWADGLPLTYGGNGRTGTQHCNFVLDGNICDSTGWTETSLITDTVKNPPGDRKMIGSVGPMDLIPGDFITLDAAFIFARDASGNSVCKLQSSADHIIDLFNRGLINGVRRTQKNELNISPNPMTDAATIHFDNPNRKKYTLRIYNVQGALVKEQETNTSNELMITRDHLSAGTYLVSLVSEENSYHAKLIIR